MSDDRAPEAIAMLRPYLGALTDAEPVRVDRAENAAYPGHTFDYAPDGTTVAVEVTRAWDEHFLAAGGIWYPIGERVEAAAREQLPHVSGRFVVTVEPADAKPPPKRAALDEHVEAVERASVATRSVEVAKGITIANHSTHAVDDLRVYVVYGSCECDLGPQSRARFGAALDRKVATLRRAGDAGYETHLAVVTTDVVDGPLVRE